MKEHLKRDMMTINYQNAIVITNTYVVVDITPNNAFSLIN